MAGFCTEEVVVISGGIIITWHISALNDSIQKALDGTSRWPKKRTWISLASIFLVSNEANRTTVR